MALPAALDAPVMCRSASLSARWSVGSHRFLPPKEARTQRTPRFRGSVPTTRRGLALRVHLGVGVNRRSRRPVWKPLESLAAYFPLEAVMIFSNDKTFSS